MGRIGVNPSIQSTIHSPVISLEVVPPAHTEALEIVDAAGSGFGALAANEMMKRLVKWDEK